MHSKYPEIGVCGLSWFSVASARGAKLLHGFPWMGLRWRRSII